ncbi:MAG: methyltransferase domain-containing protein [Pseudomonadota bacterium]
MNQAKTENYGWHTAAPPHTEAYIHDHILRLVREAGARTVLDAGCGNGALCAELARAGYDVVGIDGDEQGITLARKTTQSIRFEVGQFDKLPPVTSGSADGLFDFVVSTEVVEHLYAPHQLAEYCFAALRPGGTLAISTPYHGYLKNLALSIINGWDSHHTTGWYGGHIQFFSNKSLKSMLIRAGFEITGFIGAGRFPYLWKSMIVIARKPL